jgi:hypothetical protein
MECRASVLKTLVLTGLAVLMTGASVLVLTMP